MREDKDPHSTSQPSDNTTKHEAGEDQEKQSLKKFQKIIENEIKDSEEQKKELESLKEHVKILIDQPDKPLDPSILSSFHKHYAESNAKEMKIARNRSTEFWQFLASFYSASETDLKNSEQIKALDNNKTRIQKALEKLRGGRTEQPYAELVKEKENLLRELDEAKRKIGELQKQAEAPKTSDQPTPDITSIQARLKDLEASEITLRKEITGKNSDNERLQAEITGRNTEIERLQEEIKQKNTEIEKLQQGIAAGKNSDNERLQAEITGRNTEIERLQEELAKIADKLKEKEKEADDNFQRALSEMGEKKTQIEKVYELQAKLDALQTPKEKPHDDTEEKKQLSQIIASLQDTSNFLLAQNIPGCDPSLHGPLTKTEEMVTTDKSLKEICDKLQALILAQRDMMRNTLEAQAKQVSSMKQDIERLNQGIAALERDRTTIEGKQNEITRDAQAQIALLKQRLATAQNQITTLNQELAAAQTQISSPKQDLVAAQEALKTLQETHAMALVEHERELNEAKTSKSELEAMKLQHEEDVKNITRLTADIENKEKQIHEYADQLSMSAVKKLEDTKADQQLREALVPIILIIDKVIKGIHEIYESYIKKKDTKMQEKYEPQLIELITLRDQLNVLSQAPKEKPSRPPEKNPEEKKAPPSKTDSISIPEDIKKIMKPGEIVCKDCMVIFTQDISNKHTCPCKKILHYCPNCLLRYKMTNCAHYNCPDHALSCAECESLLCYSCSTGRAKCENCSTPFCFKPECRDKRLKRCAVDNKYYCLDCSFSTCQACGVVANSSIRVTPCKCASSKFCANCWKKYNPCAECKAVICQNCAKKCTSCTRAYCLPCASKWQKEANGKCQDCAGYDPVKGGKLLGTKCHFCESPMTFVMGSFFMCVECKNAVHPACGKLQKNKEFLCYMCQAKK